MQSEFAMFGWFAITLQATGQSHITRLYVANIRGGGEVALGAYTVTPASAEPLPHEVVRRGLAAVAPHKRAQVVVEGWGLPHERTAARVQR